MHHHSSDKDYPMKNFINPTILDPLSIKKYVNKLAIPKELQPQRIEYDKCGETSDSKKKYYTIEMKETIHQFHPDVPPTKLWTYHNNHNDGANHKKGKLAPLLINAERFDTSIIKWVNNLPLKHLLEDYIDHTLCGTGNGTPDVRNVVHLHGGAQSPIHDGDTMDWYTPGQYRIYHYPVLEQPSMLFWHDHAVGITRLNVYAGLSGGIYIIRDKKVEKKLNLPTGEKYEIPLVITDRTFDTNGQLVYSTNNSSPEHPKWNMGFEGNTISVNNNLWPYLKVEPTKYRFRIVNASDTRIYSLKLVDANNFNKPGPLFYQIGSDAGYLPEPIILNDPANNNSKRLTLAVAERADVIIDFSKHAGREFILVNTIYENSLDVNNVGQIMKIIVKDINICSPKFSIRTPKKFIRLNPKDATVVRQLILDFDPKGNSHPGSLLLNNLAYEKPVTERPLVGATEIWEIINPTNFMHPIHIHLIDFQLINRQYLNSKAYIEAVVMANPNTIHGEGIPHPVDVTPYLEGDPISPKGTGDDAWKDVIKANGNQVTRLVMKFAPLTKSGKYPFDPTTGNYVWHCHYLSHEDCDMMRPFRLYWGHNKEGGSSQQHHHH